MLLKKIEGLKNQIIGKIKIIDKEWWMLEKEDQIDKSIEGMMIEKNIKKCQDQDHGLE